MRLGQDGAVGPRRIGILAPGAGRLGRLGVQRQMRIQAAKALRQRGARLWRQVVDADVLDPVQREDRLKALFTGRPERGHVLQGESRARSEGAHTAQAGKGLRAGLHGFHCQSGLAPRLRLVGEAAVTGHLIPFKALLFAAFGRARQRLCRHRALAARVPAQDRNAVRTAPPLACHGLHGIAGLGRARAVKAHAAAR